MIYQVQLLNTSHMPQAIKDIASRWIKKLQQISKDVEVGEIKSILEYCEGEVEQEKVTKTVEDGVKSLSLLSEDTAGYNGRLLTLVSEVTKIQYENENPKSEFTWGMYNICCQIVYSELFSSAKK